MSFVIHTVWIHTKVEHFHSWTIYKYELGHVYCVDGVLDSIVDLYKYGNIDNLGVYIGEHESATKNGLF